MQTSECRVLLLDLYRPASRPIILPYLYLGAFLDYLHIEYDLYRCLDHGDELVDKVERERITHVFINLIMGPVLGTVESICRLLKERVPNVVIWVGGIAIHYVRQLLEKCPDIDNISSSHPCYDPNGFVEELYQAGLLKRVPKDPVVFPSILNNKYMNSFLHRHVYRGKQVQSINIASASGCIHRCSFCYLRRTQPWAQPIDCLLSDLVALQQKFDVHYFEFADDNFPADRTRLQSFCRAIQSSDLDFSFFCLASVDVLNADILDQMLACGLKRLYIGVDGLQPSRIRQLQKSHTTEQARRTVDLVRSYPIDLSLAVVLGTPGETRQQIQELYDWVGSVKPEVSQLSFLTPYPGTLAYQQALQLGFCPPSSLGEWGTISNLHVPKEFFNPTISKEEYLEWYQRFLLLGTRDYRSGVGESVRRL